MPKTDAKTCPRADSDGPGRAGDSQQLIAAKKNTATAHACNVTPAAALIGLALVGHGERD